MEEGLPGFKDKIEELDSSVKENINIKIFRHKTPSLAHLILLFICVFIDFANEFIHIF